ncbi:hypothetical protein CKA32_003456 [Geitlerinema sp. FC II]|nr:hypothetical protein CKA32_003456 [Geitlerinema sp. FC II]
MEIVISIVAFNLTNELDGVSRTAIPPKLSTRRSVIELQFRGI